MCCAIKRNVASDSLLRNKKIFWILIIIISIISFSLRYANINAPQYVDETTYIILAQSLSTGHLATQSSFTNVYNSTGLATISLNNGLIIVEPWFDHPPFFSILDIPFLIFGAPRLLPIILGALSTFLIMYLLRNNAVESILAGFIFAVFPFAIQLNSMMFIDNGSTFFFLLTIALTSMYEKRKMERILILAGISAGISFLNKELGVFAILYFLFYLIATRSFKKNYKWLILAIGVASSWFIMGLSINSQLFLTIFTTQFGRTSLSYNLQHIFYTALSNFSYDYNNFYIGSTSLLLVLSWIAVVGFVFIKGHKLIKIGLLSFVITMAIIRYAWFYTWIAMYPFFAIAIASCICEILNYTKHVWRHFNE